MKTHGTHANAHADTAQHQPASAQSDHGERRHTTASLGDGLAQSAVDRSPRIVAQRRAIEAALGNGQPGQALTGAAGQHAASLGDHGPVAQLNGKRRRAKRKNKEKQQEARREAAADRLDRGSPQTHSHLDPEVAANLDALDRMQPRKTAARRNIDSRATRLREANRPSVVEVGAGEGRFSSAFSKKFGENYAATDIAAEKGEHGFLGVARKANLRTKFGVDANELGQHYPQGSLDRVVGANPFGVKGVGGASYGLKVQNPGGTGKKKYLPDDRFLKTAKPLLKPGGSVELYGRSNVIRDAKLAKHPTKGLKGVAARHAEETRAAISHKYPGENANPYLAIEPDELHALAKKTGYKASVKRAKQPPNIGKGGNPDTKSGDKERADEGLKPFTTRFTFTPEEEGYESDEDDPRVTYLSDDESDWEE